jgi:DnaJ family protein B protein 4
MWFSSKVPTHPPVPAVLSDPNKRQVFDAYGEEGLKGGAPPQGAAGGMGGMGAGPNGTSFHYSGVDPQAAQRIFESLFGGGGFGGGGFGSMFGGMGGMDQDAGGRSGAGPSVRVFRGGAGGAPGGMFGSIFGGGPAGAGMGMNMGGFDDMHSAFNNTSGRGGQPDAFHAHGMRPDAFGGYDQGPLGSGAYGARPRSAPEARVPESEVPLKLTLEELYT